jgi:glycosyltransferase involved in cell wall biosynthesis
VGLILPPVDVRLNRPGAVDPTEFRHHCSVGEGETLIVIVSRLAKTLKGESLARSIDAVRALGNDRPVKLVIVGDGDARSELERCAARVNAILGREAVRFLGAMLDPRPAYAAADIVIGMGGSSLRALAFGKPVIVVGEQGFSRPFNQATAAEFLYRGMYGVGSADTPGDPLAGQISELIDRRPEWPALGRDAREFVVRHFDLEHVGSQFHALSEQYASEQPSWPLRVIDFVRTAGILALRPMTPKELRHRMRSWLVSGADGKRLSSSPPMSATK